MQKILEHVPLAGRTQMQYMHDGAPGDFGHAVRDVLSNTYHEQWIGRGGPTAWPGLNTLNFYLWGYLKPLVCAVPVDNEEALHHRNYPSIFERMRRPLMRYVEASV
jgi:hypothetical protein